MSWEDVLKIFPKRGQVAFIVLTSAGSRGKLELLQEILLQASMMVPAPPQGTTCISMVELAHVLRIPSTSWT